MWQTEDDSNESRSINYILQRCCKTLIAFKWDGSIRILNIVQGLLDLDFVTESLNTVVLWNGNI